MRSLRTKMVMIMVLLILALMTVVGSFLINGVGNYYIEDFYVQMEQTFSQDFISQLQTLAATDDGPGQMKQLLMSRSELGIDLSRRNVYILDSQGQVLDSSNQADSVSITSNILQAMNGEVGQSVSIASSIMDLAVPIQGGSEDYIVYVLDNKDTVNALTSRLFSIILQSLVLGLGICVVLAFLLSQILITPIRALTTGTRQVAAGEFSQSLDVTSRDEIGMLTRNFNHMSQVLQSTISQVENERNKLSTLFLHMTDGVVAFGPTGQVIHHNPAASRMLSRGLSGEDAFDGIFGQEASFDKLLTLKRSEYLECQKRVGDRELELFMAPFSADKTGGGLIQVTSNTKDKVRAVSCSSGDSFNFSGGQIICENTGSGTAYGVNIYNSDFTMTGGSIEVEAKSDTAYGIYLEKSSSNTTINGGRINAAGYGIYIINSSKPTISGGVEVSASGSGYAAVCVNDSYAKANISGGTFTGTDGAAGFQHISGSTGTLSGGTYSSDTGGAVCSSSIVRYLLQSGYAYYKVDDDNNVTPVESTDVNSLAGTIMILSNDYKGLAITGQPQSAEANVGNSVTFSLNAEGTDLSYQWQVSTNGGNDWTNISGATSASYTINSATKDLDGNQYRCVVRDSTGEEQTSEAATLKVYAFYTLTVESGYINDGSSSSSKPIKEGDTVHIVANAPTGSDSFIKWTWNDGVELKMNSGYSEYSSSMLFSMPSQDLTITATYGEKETYKLTVTKGTYSTTYKEGSRAPIWADDPEVGYRFDHWEWDSSIDLKFSEGSKYTSYAVIYMPGQNFEIEAVYVEDKSDYSLTVVNGTIEESDSASGSYQSGREVTLTAPEKNDENMPFWKWTSDNGGTIGNAYSATTAFVMPANPVTVTANYCDQVIKISGYMTKAAFLEALNFPETVTLTNKNGQETSVSIADWECGNLDGYDTVSNAGEYIFKAKQPSNIPHGYTWPAEGIQYVVKVEQQMVQVSLRTAYENVDEQANTITTTINGETYTLTFGEGGRAMDSGSLIFLSKETLEEYIDKSAGDDCGKHGYRLNVTITGENAENAYLNLDSIVGYKYVEDAKNGGKAASYAPEIYLIGAEPGKVVYSVPVRIMSNGTYCLEFAPDGVLLKFYTTGNDEYSLSFHGDVGEGQTYTMATVDSDASYAPNGNVFFTVTPPDEEHAWAVMVIPSDRVQTGDESGGVSIDTAWGRELDISWDEPLLFLYYSLIKNADNSFAAMYLKNNAAVVVSEINLTENQPEPVAPGQEATLSVTADYQYEKLYGMTGVSYQWYQCDADGKNAVKIEGATQPTYTTDALNAGLYYYYVEAKFDQFVEKNGYYHADGTTMYADYNSFGWASDTVTRSKVITVAVGNAASLTATVDKTTLQAGETLTVDATVRGAAGTPTGDITLYWGNPTDGGEKIAEGTLENRTATVEYIITQADVESGPDKTLYIWYSGDNNYRSAMETKEIYLVGGLTIAATPQDGQVTVTWEKPSELVTEYKLWVGLKEGIVIGAYPIKIDADETSIVVDELPDGTPFQNGTTYTFYMEAYYPGRKIISNIAEAMPNPVYSITLQTDGNGTASSSPPDSAAEGSVVTLTATPNSGYHFVRWEVVSGSIAIENNRFTMPGEAVIIRAIFERNTTRYPIYVEETDHGAVEAPTRAEAGDEVVITVTPDDGFVLGKLTITDYHGSDVSYKSLGGGKYSFVMPRATVTIQAVFIPETLPFVDVKPTDWFYEAVAYVYQNGLMNGTGATAFSPNISTTRAMIVTILWRLEGEPEVDYAMTFADVAADTWYTEAVRWAASEGIVEGYSKTAFGPNDPITREQLAAALWRYAKYQELDVSVGEDTNILSYTDAAEISEYAIPAIQWACGSGLMEGSNGALTPKGYATRAQVATMLMRWMKRA